MDAIATGQGSVMQRVGLGGRVLGLLIMIQTTIPIVIALLITVALWRVAVGVIDTVERTQAALAPHIAAVEARVAEVRAEGQRLMNEVRKIENTTRQVAGAVKESVEPIRQALLGLSSAMKTMSTALASTLDGLLTSLRKLPLLSDLPRVPVPDFDVPALELSDVEVDLNLKPDLQSVSALNGLAQEIGNQASQAVQEIVAILRFWWWTLLTCIALLVVWLLLRGVGAAARISARFHAGWRLFRGEYVEGALRLL